MAAPPVGLPTRSAGPRRMGCLPARRRPGGGERLSRGYVVLALRVLSRLLQGRKAGRWGEGEVAITAGNGSFPEQKARAARGAGRDGPAATHPLAGQRRQQPA